ncbi:MAG: hypothetical protein CMH56_16680 [Myxococcales bacterium]|nr:hypothetical protein [Myxococcales bacterium]|tara:strand:- start:309 stop:1070 length:762 start_codon:yes stop_codon:yes gene_type:complete
MNKVQHAAGDHIFKQGDPSHRAYLITEGEVEIIQENDGNAIRLGVLGPGEIFGEMGLVEEAPRSATAKATKDVSLDAIDHYEFIELLKNRPADCLAYLHSLFVRLRSMNARLVHHPAPDKPTLSSASEVHCVVKPNSDDAKQLMREEGFMITRLPFRVGRKSESPLVSNDLALDDKKPYHLSRNHFVIERKDGHVVIRDRGSFMGTQVNGKKIGGHSSEKIAFLNLGQNEVIAGGHDSPFHLAIEIIENKPLD